MLWLSVKSHGHEHLFSLLNLLRWNLKHGLGHWCLHRYRGRGRGRGRYRGLHRGLHRDWRLRCGLLDRCTHLLLKSLENRELASKLHSLLVHLVNERLRLDNVCINHLFTLDEIVKHALTYLLPTTHLVFAIVQPSFIVSSIVDEGDVHSRSSVRSLLNRKQSV